MKNALTLLAAAVIACGLFTGCKTSQVITNNADGTSVTNVVSAVDSNKLQKVVKLVTFAGSQVAIKATKKPELAADFQAAAAGIDVLLLRGQYDSQALREVLAQINVAPDDELWQLGELVLQSYDLLAGDVVSQGVDKQAWLRPVLIGIRDGLRFAPVRAVLNTP